MSKLESIKADLKALEEERIKIREKSKGFFGFLKTRVFSAPFVKLKYKFKRALVDFYMLRFYPDTSYNFHLGSVHGMDIARKADLIGFDKCREEDVLQGNIHDIQFYLSEIDLIDVRTKTDSKGHTKRVDHTVFSGMLFSIGFEDRIFPDSQIKTKVGALGKYFTKFENHTNYDFSYYTNDEELFEESLSPLFPFIEYLQKNRGSIMVSTGYKEITFLLRSNMAFLDDGKPKLSESFLNGKYYRSIAKQFNSMFFILESFAEELDALSIEDTLNHRLESIREEDLFDF